MKCFVHVPDRREDKNGQVRLLNRYGFYPLGIEQTSFVPAYRRGSPQEVGVGG